MEQRKETGMSSQYPLGYRDAYTPGANTSLAKGDTLSSAIDELEKLSLELNAMAKDLSVTLAPVCTPEGPETPPSVLAKAASCPAVGAISRVSYGLRETMSIIGSLSQRVMI